MAAVGMDRSGRRIGPEHGPAKPLLAPREPRAPCTQEGRPAPGRAFEHALEHIYGLGAVQVLVIAQQLQRQLQLCLRVLPRHRCPRWLAGLTACCWVSSVRDARGCGMRLWLRYALNRLG